MSSTSFGDFWTSNGLKLNLYRHEYHHNNSIIVPQKKISTRVKREREDKEASSSSALRNKLMNEWTAEEERKTSLPSTFTAPES